MQNAIKAYREGRSQSHAAELFGVPHSCLQRRLQSGNDYPAKVKGPQTIFNKEQEIEQQNILTESTTSYIPRKHK